MRGSQVDSNSSICLNSLYCKISHKWYALGHNVQKNNLTCKLVDPIYPKPWDVDVFKILHFYSKASYKYFVSYKLIFYHLDKEPGHHLKTRLCMQCYTVFQKFKLKFSLCNECFVTCVLHPLL